MFKNLFLMLALCLFVPSISYGKKLTLKVNPERTVKILGEINGSVMEEARKLDKLSSLSKEKIYLVINSPGGSVAPGMQFLNAMKVAKARGVKLVCVVPNEAASMAFHFLAECNSRYALTYSLLLWHPMKIGGMFVSFSADEMEYLVRVMRAWEIPLNNKLMETLDITKEQFYYHYSHETLFTTIQLQEISPDFITVIDNIKGVDDVFSMEKPKPPSFGFGFTTNKKENKKNGMDN